MRGASGSGRCSRPAWPARWRPRALSRCAASRPRIQRSGCGNSGKVPIGGKPQCHECVICARVTASAWISSSERRNCAGRVWLTTSLTPSAVTSRSAPVSVALASARAASWAVWPLVATSCQPTAAPVRSASACASWPAKASSCVPTPTPAADESPTISTRNATRPLPAMPWRSPAASGSFNAVARMRLPCAISSGSSASFAASVATRNGDDGGSVAPASRGASVSSEVIRIWRSPACASGRRPGTPPGPRDCAGACRRSRLRRRSSP